MNLDEVSLFEVVHALAREDPRIVFLGSDVAPGLLAEMADELPGQYLMEGIHEQHLIGMAAGMALEGSIPIVVTIATFLTRRCFEQVLIDVGLHELPVVLLGTGPGLAYSSLGPTHCSVEDLALMRMVPNMTVLSAADMPEANRLLAEGLTHHRPLYLRVPRGDEEPIRSSDPVCMGVPRLVRPGADLVFVATGGVTATTCQAAEVLALDGVEAGVVHIHTVSPIDARALRELVGDTPQVITAEEHRRSGGLGSAVLEALADAEFPGSVHRIGIGDEFVSGYGTHSEALAAAGLDVRGILATTRSVVAHTSVR